MNGVRGFRANPALFILSGGALVATGAVVPWLELYGGLHQYAGITGLWGKVMLIGGLLITGAAGPPALRGTRQMGSAVMLAATCIGTLAATRLVETRAFVSSAESAMLVPSVGPGLTIAIAGSVLASVGGLLLLVRPQPSPFRPR